jgi:hypothetical protein
VSVQAAALIIRSAAATVSAVRGLRFMAPFLLECSGRWLTV